MNGTEVTGLLRRMTEGDSSAQDELYAVVYAELRRLAAYQLAHERPGHSLQPTALLHEAYLRLVKMEGIPWTDRGHFYATAAKIMRHILISHARARQAQKRGAGYRPVPLDLDSAEAWEHPESILVELNEALERLEKHSPRAYKVVELKFFAGLDFEEAAQAMNLSSRTLKRDWEAAKAWLYRELSRGANSD